MSGLKRIFILCMMVWLLCGCNKQQEKVNSIDEMDISEKDTEDPVFESDYLNEILQEAKEGDIWAINYIGSAYYNGEGAEQNYGEARKWMEKGAELGNAVDQYNLGWIYEKGEGVEQDYGQALKFYSMAAEQNFPKAISALGYLNYHGYGKEIDYKEAYRLFLKSAGAFESDAIYNIAHMYEEGVGMEKDREKADMWYRIGADYRPDFEVTYDSFSKYEEDKLKSPPFYSEVIPDSLILEAQKSLFCFDPYYILNQYSTYQEVSIVDLQEKGILQGEAFNGLRNNTYCVDIDEDGKEELIFFCMEGSIGVSSFRVLKQDENGIYHFPEDIFETSMDGTRQELEYGTNGIIKYEDRYYFVVVLRDFLFRYPYYIEIYSFDGVRLGGFVCIEGKIDQEDRIDIKTYEAENTVQEIQAFIESEMTNIMERTIENPDAYIGEEYKLKEKELKNAGFAEKSDVYTSDLNNDGTKEYFFKYIWQPSSINMQNYLKLKFYTQDGQEKEMDIYDFMKDAYLSGYLQQLFVKSFNNENYIFLLHQNNYSKSFNLCVYKINGEDSELILSYLISYPFSDIKIEISNVFEPKFYKG